ncbi:hypothetical protein [Sphingomonas prati]|uniref:Uncharacterized protein n=1 Tax=Sphingomonas prati TaxID=1843237 RepID=A0A7W9BVB1_9SPHN|nr:hypothetical protein [Sphingomonas prati]MBB5730792.1 hypothetical protein [Sphingomonas prati]GGE96793.1 hypothetical protein GCM10011404_32420 [Sphingomonas prati]
MLLGRPDVRRNRRAWIALADAALFAAALVYDPGLLAWALFWCALSMAALLFLHAIYAASCNGNPLSTLTSERRETTAWPAKGETPRW